MSEIVKKATRDGFGDEIVELGRENSNVLVVDVDIGKSCKTGAFRKELPAQYLNVGIAEQNAAGVAAGLATCGKIPFVVTYAAFGSMRMVEMIRQEICYPHLNVKIGATHGGISVGEDGASHQCCEDFALMRSLPGMTVICPCDANETYQAVKAAADLGPLLLDGLADGIWIDAPGFAESEIRDIELMILQAARVRFSHTEYIACPSCGRTLYDIEKALADIKARTSHLKNLRIGVMGCIVNGPGEMADADYGYVGAGPGRITLYKGRTVVERNIPQEEALDRLVELIKKNGDWTPA